MKNFPFSRRVLTLPGSVRSASMKKRSERKAAFTNRAIAGASEASAVRICGRVGNGWILLEGQWLWNGLAHRRSRAALGADSRGGCPYASLDGRGALPTLTSYPLTSSSHEV